MRSEQQIGRRNLLRRVSVIAGSVVAARVLSARTGWLSGLPVAASNLGRQVFPPDNPWNTDISGFPTDPNSDMLIASIGLTTRLHPDFGTLYNGAPNGIPYVVVSGTQPLVPILFTEYGDESDPGPYPIPPDAPVEGGLASSGDRHVLVVDRDHGRLYELYHGYPNPDGSWRAGSGAIFDLNANALRPEGWTSADAAGLPIFPGLVRYDEVVLQGIVTHAFRFTVQRTRRAYRYPARHYASSADDPFLPPMGMRVRLKASFDLSGFTPNLQVILTAMKTYGMFVADNGSDWFVSGAPDPRWSDDELVSGFRRVQGSDFEVVGAVPPLPPPRPTAPLPPGAPPTPLPPPRPTASVSSGGATPLPLPTSRR
ncbi:MAG: hypothetical protein ACYDAR_13710 [Thermomicrobiales bacterium]